MKFSMYNFPIETKDGVILYNTKSCKFINIFKDPDLSHFRELIKTNELDEEDNMVKILFSIGFVVDDDCDEYLLVQNKIREMYTDQEKILNILIYVTENCNFRCIYCPQKHNQKVFSDENWDNLYSYVEKNVRAGKFSYLIFRFFGGEPLLERNKIIAFLKKIKNLLLDYPDIDIYCGMATNAYLLAPEVYDELVSLGVYSYQITVDGFAETHDKMRPRADGQGTWNKIIENLKYINSKNDGAEITLRANCNESNLNNIEEYFKWANDTFDNRKICFDLEPVLKFSESVSDELLSKKTPHELIALLKQFNRYANNTDPKESLYPISKTCQYTERNNFVITVDGKLVKCETAYNKDNYFIGDLKDGDCVFTEKIKDWIEDFEFDDCKTCLIYPLCAARSCPVKKIAHPNERLDCLLKRYNVEEKIRDIFLSGYMNETVRQQREAKNKKQP